MLGPDWFPIDVVIERERERKWEREREKMKEREREKKKQMHTTSNRDFRFCVMMWRLIVGPQRMRTSPYNIHRWVKKWSTMKYIYMYIHCGWSNFFIRRRPFFGNFKLKPWRQFANSKFIFQCPLWSLSRYLQNYHKLLRASLVNMQPTSQNPFSRQIAECICTGLTYWVIPFKCTFTFTFAFTFGKNIREFSRQSPYKWYVCTITNSWTMILST